MAAPDSRVPSARLVAPALLVVGLAVAVGLFARTRSGPPEGAPPRSTQVGRPVSGEAAAASPHAASGIEVGSGSANEVFQRRLQELEGQLASEPERRDLVLEMARLLHDGHRGGEAVGYYQKAIEMDPADPHAYYDLASLHGELGNWAAAADVLQDRLDRDMGDVVALYDLGAVRANQGRVDEARELLEQARGATSDGEFRARISQTLARLKGS